MKKKNLSPQLSTPVQRSNVVSALKAQTGISRSFDPSLCSWAEYTCHSGNDALTQNACRLFVVNGCSPNPRFSWNQ